MKSLMVVADGSIPQWFKEMTETQQKQYLKEHPNSKLAKNVRQQEKDGTKQPHKKDDGKKEVKKLPTVDKKPEEKKDANKILEKDGSPTNFTGPKSESDSLSGNPEMERQIVSELDKLAKMAHDAKEKGEKAPDYDLCEISIPGTNLFCQDNVGIPRAEMPQLKGKPVPGSWADKNLKKDGNGEVDAESAFRDMLKQKGIKVTKKRMDVSKLKASQTQLVGAKVAGMYEALKKDPKNPGITAPIFVSKDDYVLDGHHRWASEVGLALADGLPNPVEMDTEEVDMDIKELIKMTNDFANEIGIAQKAAKTTAASVNVHYMFGGCQGNNCLIPKTVSPRAKQIITTAHYRLNSSKSLRRDK